MHRGIKYAQLSFIIIKLNAIKHTQAHTHTQTYTHKHIGRNSICELLYLRNGHRLGGNDFAHLLKSQCRYISYRIPFLPARNGTHFDQHREREHYQKEHVRNLQIWPETYLITLKKINKKNKNKLKCRSALNVGLSYTLENYSILGYSYESYQQHCLLSKEFKYVIYIYSMQGYKQNIQIFKIR